MPQKKLLYILGHYPQMSETYIETEIRALRPRYTIAIISLGKPNLAYNNHSPYEYIENMEDLERALLDFSPDIIHSHFLYCVQVLQWASRKVEVPYTMRAHSVDVLERSEERLPRFAEFINDDSCLGVLSFPYTKPLFERAGCRSEKIHGCYPVVDFARFHDVSQNGDSVMNVGACIPKKNMDDFLFLSTALPDKNYNLYSMGYNVEEFHRMNSDLENPINIIGPVQPEDMGAEYKKHEWLVYTASRTIGEVGWPMAIAEAQAAGVGVCMQNIRPDLRGYVGEAGFLFDTVDEAAKIISQPFSKELRELGFEHAKKSDVRGHIHQLEKLWEPVLGATRERRPGPTNGGDEPPLSPPPERAGVADQMIPVARRPSGPSGRKRVRRNEPCPCGSGKKYKHCHGTVA